METDSEEEVCEDDRASFERVKRVLREGATSADSEPQLPTVIDEGDLRGVGQFLCMVEEENLAGEIHGLLDAIEQWSMSIVAPFGDRGGDTSVTPPDIRAFRVLFRSTFEAMASTESIDLRTSDGTVLRNSDLINEATERRILQCRYVGALLSAAEEGAKIVKESEILARIQGVSDHAKRANRLILSYKENVVATMRTLCDEFSDTMNTSQQYNDYIGMEAGPNNKVGMHVRKIMQDMMMNRLKRLVRYEYHPGDATSMENSAAEPTRVLRSVDNVEGIYESVRMTFQPKKVWYDASARRVIGSQMTDEVVPFSLMVKQYRQEVDEKAPSDLLEFASSEHVATQSWRHIHSEWLGHFFKGDVLLATACHGAHGLHGPPGPAQSSCGHPTCCDFMHCREWQLPRADQHSKPMWHGRFAEVPFGSETGCDPLVAGPPHTFNAVMEQRRRPVDTNAFRYHGSVQDYVKDYFDPSRNRDADDLLQSDVLRTLHEWGNELKWFRDLEVNENRHVYAFGDGLLVCDASLENCPTFYPYESHVFHAGEKYHRLQTVKVEASLCFRPDALRGMLSTVLPPLTFPRDDFLEMRYGESWRSKLSEDQIERFSDPVPCCGHCGLERRECAAVNQLLSFEGRCTCAVHEIVQKVVLLEPSQGTGVRDADVLGSMSTITGRRFGTVMDRHCYQPFRDPTRRDCQAIAQRVDCTQFDEILWTQFENRDQWMSLPGHLRSPESKEEGVFYRDEARRLNYEARALLGRLLYRNREMRDSHGHVDSWQIFLFIKGASGTGKSTILNLIERIVGRKNVAIIDCATFEKQFGTYPLVCGDLVAMNEVGDINFSPNMVLQMVDGSLMSVPRKNRDAFMGEMRGPIILLGNKAPNIHLSAGQWGRRQLMLGFERIMTEQRSKPSLEKEIVHVHYPHLVYSLYAAYWSLIEEKGHMDVWQTTRRGEEVQYDALSWMWHHQRKKSDCQSNVLGRILSKLRADATNDSPNVLMHGDQSIAGFVQLVQSSKHWVCSDDNVWSLTPENVSPAIKSMFGIPTVMLENRQFADFSPRVAYMPFEHIDFPTTDGGHEATHAGFKTMCNQTMIAIQGGGSRMTTTLPWGDEEDFYRSAFSANNLTVYEGKLPYPPWSPHLVHTKWIIGITDKKMFSVSESSVHDTYDGLKTAIRSGPPIVSVS